MTNKSVLITGCAGYIGSVLAMNFLKKDYFVFGVYNLSTGSKKTINKLNKEKQFNFIKADFSSAKVSKLIYKNNIKNIFHLAAFINVGESNLKKNKYLNNNYKKTVLFLKKFEKIKINNFFFASTCAVDNNGKPPNSIYGLSKKLSEKSIIKYAIKYKFNSINLRFYNVVGADNEFNLGKTNKSDHLFTNIISVIKKNKNFEIYGSNYNTKDGTAARDYIHVKDLANIQINTLNYMKDKKNKNITINCGYGKSYTVLEILSVFEKLLKVKLKKSFIKARSGDLGSVYVKKPSSILTKIFKARYNNIQKIIRSELTFNKLV